MNQQVIPRFKVVFVCNGEFRETITYNCSRSKDAVIDEITDCYGVDIIILDIEEIIIH